MLNHEPLNRQHSFGRTEYSSAERPEAAIQKRYDYAYNPCQTGDEEECIAWINEQLMACYND